MTAATRLLAERVVQFLKAWEPIELYITLAQCNCFCVLERKLTAFEQERRVIQIISSFTNNLLFVSVSEE